MDINELPAQAESINQQASAWEAVYALLLELVPGFGNLAATGQESALLAIRQLAHRERQAGEAVAWMPIETAPKDGTHILLANKAGVSAGGWLSDLDHGADWEGQIGMAGWWRADGADWPATHWMPLPAAPGVASTPAPKVVQADDVDRLLREVFELCEATEDAPEVEPKNEHQRGFDKGRRFEAKGIRKAIGAWFQDTFCGRSFMGEPAIAAPVAQPANEAVASHGLEATDVASQISANVSHKTEAEQAEAPKQFCSCPCCREGIPAPHEFHLEKRATLPPAIKAEPVAPPVQEREVFEAYIAKDCGDLSTFGVDPNRHYKNSGVNHEWMGWQARAAISKKEQS